MLPQDPGGNHRRSRRRVSDPVLRAPVPVLRAPVPERRVTCVLVGDGAVGKTSLVVSYTTNGYPAEYVPTALDNFTVMVVVDGRPVRLQLCDMAGQDDLERLRPLCYRDANVFLLCYSVVRPASFRSLARRWVPEVRRYRPGPALVLVGTQLDLRDDAEVLVRLAAAHERPVSTAEGRRLAREIGAAGFTECSALTQKNLKDAFDAAILASIGEEEEEEEQEEQEEEEEKKKLLLLTKTPKKLHSVTEAWWRKISCLVGEQPCHP
ncbi:hypothetical protein CRUP_001091 [Coryphaenoides rupestris]|nr:hypothetical protein CRUP_001091 [Coryphaenoides rupestris]